MHAPDAWLPKRRVGSATARSAKLPLRRAPSRFGFPNPRSSLCRPVSQSTKRAPYMDPEAMKPVRPRSCPRDRSDLTAQVAHTRCQPSAPVSRDERSTSCMGRLRHEAHTVVSVARLAGTNLTARGSRTRAAVPPGFPNRKLPNRTVHPNSRATAPPGFPSGEAAPAARVACTLKPTPPPRSPEVSALAPSHRLLER